MSLENNGMQTWAADSVSASQSLLRIDGFLSIWMPSTVTVRSRRPKPLKMEPLLLLGWISILSSTLPLFVCWTVAPQNNQQKGMSEVSAQEFLGLRQFNDSFGIMRNMCSGYKSTPLYLRSSQEISICTQYSKLVYVLSTQNNGSDNIDYFADFSRALVARFLKSTQPLTIRLWSRNNFLPSSMHATPTFRMLEYWNQKSL